MFNTLSARAENAAAIAEECPFVYVVQLLGAHWRPAILWKIHEGIGTYNAIRRALPKISDKALSMDLIGLAERGLIERVALSTELRRSRYLVTARGASLIPVLRVMQDWFSRDGAVDFAAGVGGGPSTSLGVTASTGSTSCSG